MCSGDHIPTRLSTTGIRYPTAEKTACPHLLCERIAHVMNDKTIELGRAPVPALNKRTSARLQLSKFCKMSTWASCPVDTPSYTPGPSN